MEKIRLAAVCILLLPTMILQGCSGNDHGLGPDKPTTLTLWRYCSGSQKQAFDELADESNETRRRKQGTSVNAVAKGSISNISADLKDSLEKKVNAPKLPNISAAYGDTAEDIEKAERLVSINDYMSDEEMAEYIDDCMGDGNLHDHAYVNIFPVAKATEVMVINKNIWDEFTKKENVKLSDLDTWEGLARVSEKYYTCSGGKAFLARDAFMNYPNTGNKQLGIPLFFITEHAGSFAANRKTVRELWDQYYVPFIKGYYAKDGRLASDNMKTEDVAAYVSSSAEATFSPREIVRDNSIDCIVEYITRGVPSSEGKKNYAITQGAGMVVSKNDEAHEYASIQFLKRLTGKERNTLFSTGSSYSPVKKETNSFASWNTTTETEKVTANQLVRNIVETSMETVSTSTLTSQKSFSRSYEIHSYLETTLNEKYTADARQTQQAVKNKDSREKAWKPYLNDENFNTRSE